MRGPPEPLKISYSWNFLVIWLAQPTFSKHPIGRLARPQSYQCVRPIDITKGVTFMSIKSGCGRTS